MLMGPGWKLGQILNEKDGCPAMEDKIGAFALPGQTPAPTAPAFLGGSNLAISANSENPELAYDLLKIMVGEGYQKQFAELGHHPGAEVAARTRSAATPGRRPRPTRRPNSRFVPSSENWAGVEASTVLPDMLVAIAQGGDVEGEAAQADEADHQPAQRLSPAVRGAGRVGHGHR